MKWFLSTLLHHANRTIRTERFYAIKNKLLARFGKIVGYDIQFIAGKECFTCDGTGIYHGYYPSGGRWSDTCNRCWGGWYKAPTWNILAKVRFGKFTFHQPKERCYSEDAVREYLATNRCNAHSVFDGYIEHRGTKFGPYAVVILFWIFKHPLPYDFNFGLGWRLKWWSPDAWLNNFLWFYHRRNDRTDFAAWYRYFAAKAVARWPDWVEM